MRIIRRQSNPVSIVGADVSGGNESQSETVIKSYNIGKFHIGNAHDGTIDFSEDDFTLQCSSPRYFTEVILRRYTSLSAWENSPDDEISGSNVPRGPDEAETVSFVSLSTSAPALGGYSESGTIPEISFVIDQMTRTYYILDGEPEPHVVAWVSPMAVTINDLVEEFRGGANGWPTLFTSSRSSLNDPGFPPDPPEPEQWGRLYARVTKSCAGRSLFGGQIASGPPTLSPQRNKRVIVKSAKQIASQISF